MATPVQLRLASDGFAEVLTSPTVAAAVRDLAEQVAAAARTQGRAARSGAPIPVVVDSYTTDRAASSVTLAHPAGLGLQGKHGVLTRAAGACGLTVVSRR